MPKQKDTGKAFEYVTLITLYNSLQEDQQVEIIKTPAFNNAESSYNSSEESLKTNMDLAAKAAIKVLLKMEPNLENSKDNSPLFLSLQEDSTGQKGDVRDILTVRKQNGWEIGISCKHNHTAVKHNRLSSNIDFGNKWFKIPVSQKYFDEINPLFNELKEMKEKKLLWRDVENKEERFYMPLLKSFMDELNRLDSQNSEVVPDRLLKYLLGKYDFYKIITNDSQHTTKIQAFNINNTLNCSAGNIRPKDRAPRLTMPKRFHSIDFKANSTNTIIIVCDGGWTISMRIHSAKSEVEPSLKFDVRLEGISSKLYSHVEHWGC